MTPIDVVDRMGDLGLLLLGLALLCIGLAAIGVLLGRAEQRELDREETDRIIRAHGFIAIEPKVRCRAGHHVRREDCTFTHERGWECRLHEQQRRRSGAA